MEKKAKNVLKKLVNTDPAGAFCLEKTLRSIFGQRLTLHDIILSFYPFPNDKF